MVAGIVLVREAGGLVSQVDGRSNMLESGDILAANELLHGDIGNILRRALASGN